MRTSTSKHISVEDLLSKINDSTSLNIIKRDIITDVIDEVTYIHPELEIKVENSSAPFIIISAPGAVGKTTFAKYSANKKNGFFWDLSTLKLGDNTFSGTLLEAFGANEISKVLEGISNGDVTLFIDSLDEAEIVSGWIGIEKFLTELVNYAKNSTSPNIVIFSRSETAIEIQLKLEDIAGQCYSVYEIDYFAKERAVDFIENRILQKPSNHENFREPFLKAVNNIFTTIGLGINDSAEDLWDDAEIRCFLGYSPVLQTIGDYLHDQNYAEVAKQFDSKQDVESGLSIIQEFISRILIREKEKFVKGLKEKTSNIAEWNQWDTLYSNDDQVKFVLNSLAKRPLKENVDSVNGIPNWLEKDFTDSLSYFILNHPFIKDGKFSSPAFRDYVLSYLIFNEDFEETCLKLLTGGHFVLTPLFSYFYRNNTENSCKGKHVGFIYESVSARTSLQGNSLLTYIRKDNNDIILEIVNTAGTKTDNISLKCIIDEKNPLTFYSRLINTVIDIDNDVFLGRSNGSFDLQNVEIWASRIHVISKDLIVNCHDENNSVMIAGEIITTDHSLAIIKIGKGDFIVNGSGTQSYPWATYFKQYDKNSVEDYKEELYLLKRILEPFRKHSKAEFAKQSEFIDNEIIKNIPIRKNLLKYMMELGIIQNGPEKKYYMSEDISIKYGINWGDLKSLNFNDSLFNFFKDFRRQYGNHNLV